MPASPARVLPSPDESAASANLVEAVVSATRLTEYCDLRTSLPVHVHASSGEPDLAAHAIHLFPDGFDDDTVEIHDPDRGSDRFVAFKGNLRCRSLHTGNWLGVEGTLECLVLEGRSGCNRATVASRIVAELVLEHGHSFECATIRAGIVYSGHGMVTDPGDGSIGALGDDARALFVPELVDDDGPRWEEIKRAVLDGGRWKLFRA